MARTAETVSNLTDLVGGRHTGAGNVAVDDAFHDSRRVEPGSLFIALRGGDFDGHGFVADAVNRGALAVCVEREVDAGVPEIIVEDARTVAGPLAARIHGDPSHHMAVIGVTGTNGKTTVTHFVESIANASGARTGLVGTIATRIAGESYSATLTTPEAPDFQRMLAAMVIAGVGIAAVEVSSHGLELMRVKGTRFKVAAFTNLSQDHLDFHGDMDAYRRAKERLFTEYEVETAVFNIDDPVGADLAHSYDGPAYTVGRGGDVSIHDIDGQIHIETPWGATRLTPPVVGAFNLSNLSVALACCVAAGLDFSTVASALPSVAVVPGRFELVSADDPIAVIVDYAHTPEAVARSIEAGRELATGRVIALLGAGGDRDRQKRPAMGEALVSADLAIVTSDNPRSEDPELIAQQVASGIDTEHLLEVDRHKAIGTAIDRADDGDVVLVLGRGHEPFQQIGSTKIPFDDREVAAEALRRRRSAESGSTSGSMTP